MSTVDLLIHVHPELDAQKRADVENLVSGCVGVGCAEFNHHAHPHALVVKYDPDAVYGRHILDIVRKVDPLATMVGL